MITKPTFQEHECPRRVWATGPKTMRTGKQHIPKPKYIYIRIWPPSSYERKCQVDPENHVFFAIVFLSMPLYPTRSPVTLLLLLTKHPFCNWNIPDKGWSFHYLHQLTVGMYVPATTRGSFLNSVFSSECHWQNDALCLPLIHTKRGYPLLLPCWSWWIHKLGVIGRHNSSDYLM